MGHKNAKNRSTYNRYAASAGSFQNVGPPLHLVTRIFPFYPCRNFLLAFRNNPKFKLLPPGLEPDDLR